MHQVIGLFSLRSADPEYIYFISGLSIANGKMILGHIDNPGTPLQYLTALVFRMVYLLRDHQVSFNEDVFANADMYLRVLNLIMTVVVSAFMYYAGIVAYRVTKHFSYSIVLQLAPLFTEIIFGNIGRITPENLMPLPAVLLSLLLLKHIFLSEDENFKQQWIWFGLISGFGLSIKLTYFPLWVIPLIVISTWKDKIRYSLVAIFSFLIMALPVTFQIQIFWQWIKSLFLHSGKYGSGDSNIVNWQILAPNFNNLWHENQYFFYIVLALLAAIVLSFTFQKDSHSRLVQRISLAILTAVMLQTAIVCKQYEPRYFIPALMLFPLVLILIIENIRQLNAIISGYKIPEIALAIFISFYFINQIPVLHNLSTHFDQEKERKMPALHYLESIEKNAVKFLVPDGYGCPSPEYALMCSYGWAGKQKALFKPFLAKVFPDTYIWYPWDKTFNYWGNEPSKDLVRPVYIYLVNDNIKEDFINSTKNYFPEKYELIRTFFNDATNEAVYKLVKSSSE
jgi:hypothetical protein